MNAVEVFKNSLVIYRNSSLRESQNIFPPIITIITNIERGKSMSRPHNWCAKAPLFMSCLFFYEYVEGKAHSTYFTVRGQSYFSRHPKYWPPIPLSARRVCCGGRTADRPQAADRIPSPLPLRVARTGRNHLNEKFTPLLPTGIGERF
jgi:hypothetical protein